MKTRALTDMAQRTNVRVSLTLPLALLDAIDAEAARIGVRRSALVEYWVAREMAGSVAARCIPPRPPAPDNGTK